MNPIVTLRPSRSATRTRRCSVSPARSSSPAPARRLSPAAASRVPDRDRSNSVTPSSRSSAAMDRLRAGCAICSISAARPKFSSSASFRKYRSRRRSKSPMSLIEPARTPPPAPGRLIPAQGSPLSQSLARLAATERTGPDPAGRAGPTASSRGCLEGFGQLAGLLVGVGQGSLAQRQGLGERRDDKGVGELGGDDGQVEAESRTSSPEVPPRVEYALIPLGAGLLDVAGSLLEWAS